MSMPMSRRLVRSALLSTGAWISMALMVAGTAPASAGIKGFSAEDLAAAAHSQVLAIGPVESADLRERTITVLGQRFVVSSSSYIQLAQTPNLATNLRALKSLQVGAYVAASGELHGGVLMLTELRHSADSYVSGSSAVFLRGVVTAVDYSRGQLFVGSAWIDYTPTLAGGLLYQPSMGSTIEIYGTQPTPRGMLVATSVGWEAANGISGGDMSGISGGDAMSGISGGDALSGISGGDMNGISGGDLRN